MALNLIALIIPTLMLGLPHVVVRANPALQGEADFGAVDTYVAEQMNELGIPGMALGVVQDGRIVHLQGFGVADSSGRGVTPQTPFYIGSVTKSFTALAVMQLVEAGKIDLDAPVQTYLPWFQLADREVSAAITVRNLLNHTSGISTKDGNRIWSSQQGLEETVSALDAIHHAQPVGTAFRYSNINFGIAGLIVEEVGGQPYADYVTQHIFEPLEMRHSYASRAPALADGLSEGHYYMFGRVFKDGRILPSAGLPSGNLISSVEDMSRYAIAFLNEGRYGEAAILSALGIAEIHAPAIPTGEGDDHYAMGWNTGTWEGMSAVFHNGDVGNFHSTVLLLPDRGLGFVLLANASGFEQLGQVDQVAVGVASVLIGKSPDSISLPFLPRFLYWGLLLTPLMMIVGSVVVWRRRQRIRGWRVLLTVALHLFVVSLLLAFSQLIPFPLSSMLVFYPEVAYGLIATAALGIGSSIGYTAMYLKMRRSDQGLLDQRDNPFRGAEA